MAADSSTPPRARSTFRSRIAIGLLVLIVGFIGYGFFERSRLFAEVKNERKAVEAIRDLKGMAIESAVQDWRVIFVNDQPQIAMRVGGVYIPNEGAGPGYTDKVLEQLRALGGCKEIIISAGPVSGAMRMGPTPKRVLKSGEIPPETLDLAAIRKEFPHLKVSGEEHLIRAEQAADESASISSGTAQKDDRSGDQKPLDAAKKDDREKAP
jgi:hypothetical protein